MLAPIRLALAGAAVVLFAAALPAQLTTFIGFDAGASGAGPSARAAFDAFRQATGGTVRATFEGTLPAGLGIAGGDVLDAETCARALCGGNTTAGGRRFLEPGVFGPTTFTFATSVDHFGVFVGGLQLGSNLFTVLTSAGTVTLSLPADRTAGGFAFVGIAGAGTITRVDFTSGDANGSDIVSMDDVVFGLRAQQVVPEPPASGLVAAGLVCLLATVRRRMRA